MPGKAVYTVGQVNSYIARMFSGDWLLRSITVRGEVSNCKYHSSGHIYFTLKDTSGTLSCVMFAGKRRGGLSFRMKEGDAVVVDGQVRVFERAGSYQLYADRIVPDGVGLLNERYELLKKKLEEMGMFSEQYKQPIPRYIRRLGVVTAPTGAAVRDIIQISRRRNPFIQIILYPAIVQGDLAPRSIVTGIQMLDRAGVDTIIVGRGGGSLEDLWAFNEEIVAQAVFDCSTPVISAVGHEVDTVITDYVADLRAPTPSAAAELAVFDYNQFQADLQSMRADLQQGMVQELTALRDRTEAYRKELINVSPVNRLQTQKMTAAQNEDRLRTIMNRRLEQWRSRLDLEDIFTASMRRSVLQWRSRLGMEEQFRHTMDRKLQDRKHEMQLLAAGLEKNSPLTRLSGGYGFITDADGCSVTSVGSVTQGDEVNIRMKDGRIRSRVIDTEKWERPLTEAGKDQRDDR